MESGWRMREKSKESGKKKENEPTAFYNVR